MKSFALLKTNVGLTTNIKIMVDSDYNLFLDSIESSPELSADKFKKVQFSSKNYYDELISYFYNGLNAEIAYRVKDDNSSELMFTSFDKQIDDLYIAGCSNIIDNKFYTEDFEYFAPLHINKSSIPKYFAIFRVDGPGIIDLNKDNFTKEILDKLKCVKVYDLTRSSKLGEWLYDNITNNPVFPLTPVEIDYRNAELSYWNGIDFDDGCFTQKSIFLETNLQSEMTFFDFEKFIYDGFKNNKIVYPNILNFSFLFNDEPATPNSLRKWSLNRYCGFYLEDMISTTSISTYVASILTDDAYIIDGNIIKNTNNLPFNEATLKLDNIFVEYLGNFYEVKKVYKTDTYGIETLYWTIISDLDLSGKESLINKNIVNIDSNNKITNLDGTPYIIEDWDTADVWLIKIGDKFHNLQYDSGNYYIYSDYGFNMLSEELNYYINYPDPNYSYYVNMLENYFPKSFPIFKLKFSDIKTFDESIIDTEFSKLQYDIEDTVIQTDEPKNYLTDLNSKSNPKAFVDFIINNKAVNIPSASHYTANNETFQIEDNALTKLWRKNPVYSKWGFSNSLSNDYPYLLNNSFAAEEFNKSPNTYINKLSRIDRNLDYFLTINSSTSSYSNHNLHIEEVINNSISATYSFDLNQYLDNSYDYFNTFFDRKHYFNNSKLVKNAKKYSYFNIGDKNTANTTLFNGIKFKLYDVDSVKIIDGELSTINIKNRNTFDDYRFSVLLSDNNYTINLDALDFNKLSLTYSNNQLNWSVVDFWKRDKYYDINNIVIYESILYYNPATSSYITDTNINPANSSDWSYYNNTIIWSPENTYTTYTSTLTSSIVYNSGEYYYNNGVSGNTFYIPGYTYSYNDIVKYNNRVWISMTSSNNKNPDSTLIWYDSANNANFFWEETTEEDSTGTPQTNWSVVQIWDSLNIYTTNNLVIYEEVLYSCNVIATTMGETPDSTVDWTKLYTLLPDTNYYYNNTVSNNNLIYLNNRYYICQSNNNNSTLDNGIYIFINKKWKNALINIYINDNTLVNLSNTDRDDLYKEIYSNLSALNFINCINDIKNKYGFTNYVKYIILEDSGNKIYDFENINSYKNLTCLLTAEGPDDFKVLINSLKKLPATLNDSQFSVNFKLNNGTILNKSQLNYYNNLSLGSNISKNEEEPEIIPNYSSLKNEVYNTIYRHSGFYEPIFLDIQLFKAGLTYSGNFIFDTELTDFGKIDQLIISKINRKGNILKLRNSPNLKSIYPMIDEFGYTLNNLFIFKSNWDNTYFIECNPIVITISPIKNTTRRYIVDETVKYQPISITPNKLL